MGEKSRKIKMSSRIVLSATIETETEEKIIFEEFKKWMNENFQNFNMQVAGKKETLRHEGTMKKWEKEKKSP